MNRRMFLTQPMLYPIERKSIQKQVMLDSKDNGSIFQSVNGKLLIKTNYIDDGDAVLVVSNKVWFDPISKSEKTKMDKELFILDYDNL